MGKLQEIMSSGQNQGCPVDFPINQSIEHHVWHMWTYLMLKSPMWSRFYMVEIPFWLPIFCGMNCRKSCWRHKTSAPWSGSAWRTARSARACRRQHWWSSCKAKLEPNCVSGTAWYVSYVHYINILCTVYNYVCVCVCLCKQNVSVV